MSAFALVCAYLVAGIFAGTVYMAADLKWRDNHINVLAAFQFCSLLILLANGIAEASS